MEYAVGYARISDQDQSNTSIEDQPIIIKEYCERVGLNLTKVFIENGKSAFTFDRPEWKDLETLIKKDKRIKFIVVKHIDRFSRADLVDALVKIREIEQKLKVRILTVKDTLAQDTNELGFKLLRTMELLMSNNERNRIQERTQDGVYRSLANGRWINMAPYGYTNSRDSQNKPILLINEVEADNVKKAFNLFLNGLGAFEIADKLGLKNKRRSFVTDILKRKLYAGIIDVPAHKGKLAYETTSINEPIISKSIYYQVQNMNRFKGNKYHGNDEVWLRGILSCNECGKPMTAGRSKGKKGVYYWYYKCGTHRVNYSANKVHNLVHEILEHFSLPKSTIENVLKSVKAQITEMDKNKGFDLQKINTELSKVKKRISDAQEKYLLNEDISKETYTNVISGLKAKESELQEKINEVNTDVNLTDAKLHEIILQLSNIKTVFQNLSCELKQRFISVVLSRSLCYTGQHLLIENLHPFFSSKYAAVKALNLLEIKNPDINYIEVSSCSRNITIGQLADFLFIL
ncbi:MAG: recombinase family protein [Candidatus Methylacidiphilales bacterium]